jgi:hypothetical protein
LSAERDLMYLPRGHILIIFGLDNQAVILKLLQIFKAALLFSDEL